MGLHNLEDRLVQLKKDGKLNYEWKQLYAGSLVIKTTEDLYAFIGLLRKDINNEEFFRKISYNPFTPSEFNDIKFIIIHKADIKSTKAYTKFKDKFQREIKNQDLMDKAEKWIAQFPFFDWKIYALKLLFNIIYLDEDDIEEQLIEIKKYMGAPDDFVISDIEGATKSSAHLFYQFNKIISSKNFIPSKDLEPSDDRGIVFIDDMIGTGNQAINYIQKLKGDNKIGSQKLYYYAIMGLKDGIKNLEDSGLFKNVSATIELPKRTFKSGYIFTAEDSGTAKDMVSFIGEQLTKNMKDIGPLGYKNSEALVFFRHNTPNNSLPIFWASGMCRILEKVGESTEVRWDPLFPRKEKPKSEPKLTGGYVDTDTRAMFQNQKLIYFDLIKTVMKKSFGSTDIDNLRGLAIGKERRIYISDMGNNKIHIFSSKFKYETSFGNKGSEPGNFNGPRGIAIDTDDNVYVVDRDNSRIQKFDYTGNFIDQFGSEDERSLLVIPWGISIDKFDNIYVSSAGSNQIKKFDKNGRLIKYWGESGKGEGQFNNPLGIAIDKFQNVYIADNLNNRIQKFDQEGNYLLEWGTYGDEPGQMNNPYAIAIFNEILYVAEPINFRIQIFDLNGNYMGKLQTKPENIFFSCKGLAVDNEGDFYISNTEMHHIIQLKCKIPTSDHGWTNKTVAASFVEKKMELKIFDKFIMRKMPENTICIHGFGGTGKSTLLKRFAVRAKEQKIQVIYGSMRGQNLSSFILTYANCMELKSEYASYSDFIFLDHFLKVVDKPTVVFIDDYPETSEKDELTNWLIDESQRRDSNVLFVLASRSKPNYQSTSPVRYMELSGMSHDETKEFITRSAHLRSNWIKETVEYLDDIYLITSGNPKVIELLCTDQRAWDFFKKHPDMQLHTIRDVNLLYGQIWQNLKTTTKDAAKLLATCVQVSPYIHGGLIRDLIPNWEFEMNNLLTRSLLAEVGNDLFSLHDTFKDFIYQDCLGMIERSKYHQQLASYYYLNDRLKNRNMYSLIHYVEARKLKDIIQVYSEGTKTMESVSNINVVRDLEERILSLIKASGDEIQNIKDFECLVLINLAEHNRVLSDYQAAISNFEKALRLANTCNFHKSIVVCNSGMGDVYRRMGEYELALKHYWNAHDICQSYEISERARVYTGLGAASKMLCKYWDALEFHKKAKSLYNEIGDKKGICRNLRGHAASLNIIGDYGGALREYTAAKEIYETEVSDERGRAYALWGCGESSRMMGKYHDALTYFGEAIDIARAIGDSWAEIYLNLNMGELYRSNRELTDAKTKFDAAIELATKKQSQVECAYGKLGLAETKRLEGIFDYKIYDEVLITFKEHDSCWGIVHGHIGKALAYLSQGDQDFYKIIIDQARKVCQQKNMEREIQILKAIESESGRDYLHPMNFP